MNQIATAGVAARRAAAALLAGILDHGQPLDLLLDGERAYRDLDERDRRLARAIVSTALRRHGAITAILDRLITKKPPRSRAFFHILEIAAAQVLYMEVAHHAAVSIAVEEIGRDPKSAHLKGLANAVLRRIGREREQLLAESAAAEVNAPDWLWRRWCRTYGEPTARGIVEAHLGEPPLDISVKDDVAGWAAKLDGTALTSTTVRLSSRPQVDTLPGFAEGAWWVQDVAAALPARLLGEFAGKRVADLCAAPGGKTAALASRGAEVTAVDISEKRLTRLAANLSRLRLKAEVVAADILDWRPEKPFDAVLLDAPCSATGTIRRHPEVQWLRTEGDIASLAGLQSRMIAAAADMLKPGGMLVYSTCSLEPEEGEAQLGTVRPGTGLIPAAIAPEELPGFAAVTPAGVVRTLPCQQIGPTGTGGMDGFFIARFEKR
jgi:16S rRNA (cytosine967-C5)-methyltransferase